MGLWDQWVKNKRFLEQENLASDPDQIFKFNSDDTELGVDHDAIKHELFDLVWNKYTDESMQFFSGIAQRGDQEIALLLRKLEKDATPSQMKEPRHPSDDNEVVPPNADTGHSDDGGGDD